MTVSDARKLKELEDQNQRLKKLVAEQALDIRVVGLRNEVPRYVIETGILT